MSVKQLTEQAAIVAQMLMLRLETNAMMGTLPESWAALAKVVAANMLALIILPYQTSRTAVSLYA